MHEFETIEDAVIAALGGLKTAGTVRILEPYAGQLGEADLRQMTHLFPCLYVVCQGMEIAWSGSLSEQTVTVLLLVGSRNLRGSVAAARGDSGHGGPGAYDVLEASRLILHRKVAVPGWSALRAVREAPVVYAPETGVCVYEAAYEVRRKAL